MSPRCFEIISGILGDFKVFTLRMRLRHFDRRLDMHMEPSPSIPSHPREPRKAQRPSDISKIHLEKEIKAFDHPFGRMGAGLGE